MFFQQLSTLLATCASLTITLTANEDGTLNVVAIPKAKKEGENAALTTPLALSGSPVELDAEFATIISSFTDKRKSLAEQLEATESILEAAKKESAANATKAVKKASTANAKPAKSAPKALPSDESGAEEDDDEDKDATTGAATGGEPSTPAAEKSASSSADNLWE